MNHDAIYALYPNVVTVDDTAGAMDANGDTVEVDMTQEKRLAEYPTWNEQLDNIYHNGIDAWKADIKAIKDKYPKPE